MPTDEAPQTLDTVVSNLEARISNEGTVVASPDEQEASARVAALAHDVEGSPTGGAGTRMGPTRKPTRIVWGVGGKKMMVEVRPNRNCATVRAW